MSDSFDQINKNDLDQIKEAIRDKKSTIKSITIHNASK